MSWSTAPEDRQARLEASGLTQRVQGVLSVLSNRLSGLFLSAGMLAVVFVAVIVTATFDRLGYALQLIGAVVVLGAVVGIFASGAAVQGRRFPLKVTNRGVGAPSGEPSSDPHLPEVVPLASAWNGETAGRALGRFIEGFDMTLDALRRKLDHELQLDDGTVEPLPLHEKISLAENLSIWRPVDVHDWRKCLALRTAILAEGRAVPLSVLGRYVDWLADLSRYTLSGLPRDDRPVPSRLRPAPEPAPLGRPAPRSVS